MAIRYPIKKQTLGANGLAGPMVVVERLRFVLVVFSGGLVTVSWVDEEGRTSSWDVSVAVKLLSTWTQPTKISGNGAVVQGAWLTPDDDLDPESLLVGNTVTTDIGTANPSPLALESGNLLVAVNRLTSILANLPQVTTSHGQALNVHDQGA